LDDTLSSYKKVYTNADKVVLPPSLSLMICFLKPVIKNKKLESTFIIPDKPDHLLVYLTAFSYFDELSEIGVRFYLYLEGFLQHKIILIDDMAAAVGTANFDNRSFRLNFEITAFIVDQPFNRQIEAMLETDLQNTREMKREELRHKPFWFKLAVRYARLTAPIQ
jgi:cardiolipin synthase